MGSSQIDFGSTRVGTYGVIMLLASMAWANAQEAATNELPPPPAEAESLEEWLDDGSHERVARVREGRFALPTLLAPTTATETIGNGRTPQGFRYGAPTPLQSLPETGSWDWTMAHWVAADTYSNPRYFEDRMLERHGVQRYPHWQPLISGARFFATVPMLPYLMTVSHPCEQESTLGYYRSGSRAPGLRQRPPFSKRATWVETAAIGAAIIALP